MSIERLKGLSSTYKPKAMMKTPSRAIVRNQEYTDSDSKDCVVKVTLIFCKRPV